MRRRLSQTERKAVYDKYNGHCAYCGCDIPFKGFNVDHLHCLRNYEYTEEFTGIDVHSIDNLMPACGSCNRYKATMDLETFRKQLQKIPDRLQRAVCTYNIALRYRMVQENREPIKFYFERVKQYCSTCKWYAEYSEYEGVCCNGESEFRVDFRNLDDTCEEWEELDER